MAFILTIVLTLSLMQVPTAYSAEWSAPDEALVFLEDVVELDMTKYNAILDIYDVRYPPHLGGLAQENVHYLLESNESKLDVAFAFVNETLDHCGLWVVEGSPLYSQPQPTNVLDMAKDLLQRYQNYTRALDSEGMRDFEGMRNVLDTVDEIEDMTTTLGNWKLKVTTGADYTAFEWIYMLGGLDFPGLTLEFLKGTFCGLGDIWSKYKVGSTDVNVSKEEAINIAWKHVENFSWTVDGVEVTDFNILEEPLTASLLTTRSREEPLTLYPHWRIELYLDKVYPGMVNRISLAIWADTGEVISCVPLGGGGGLPPDTSPPVADAGVDQTVNENSQVSFNASSSSDNVGIASCEWDFGDGTTGQGLATTHTYSEPGTYNVTLTVTDEVGNSNTNSITVTVEEAPIDSSWWITSIVILIVLAAVVSIIIIFRKKQSSAKK